MANNIVYRIALTSEELALLGRAVELLPYGEVKVLVASVERQIAEHERAAVISAQEQAKAAVEKPKRGRKPKAKPITAVANGSMIISR